MEIKVCAQVDSPPNRPLISTNFLQPVAGIQDFTPVKPARWIPTQTVKLAMNPWYENYMLMHSFYTDQAWSYVGWVQPVYFQMLPTPSTALFAWDAWFGEGPKIPAIALPPIPFGFFCRFEDNLARKLPVPLDFGTD